MPRAIQHKIAVLVDLILDGVPVFLHGVRKLRRQFQRLGVAGFINQSRFGAIVPAATSCARCSGNASLFEADQSMPHPFAMPVRLASAERLANLLCRGRAME